MYILYLDDSGSPANPGEDYFVLGGICVPEQSIYWLTKQLDELAKTISPDDPSVVEFHASEIFRGAKPPWDKFKKKEERIDIIKKVLRILDNAKENIVSFACAIHKKSYSGKDLVELAFEDLLSRFDLYLTRFYHQNKDQQRGLIVLDKTTYETSLQKLAISFRNIGTRWRGINNIDEVPLFVDSKACRIVQLADHIAYAVFRRYNASDLNYFNCIEDRFDKENGKIHGLCHKQTYKTNCTCPACLTRS